MPAGTVVDRFNRASLIVFSMLLGAISVGLLAWFAVYYGFNLYLLIAAASAWSIGMELFRSSSNSILPDIVESGRLSRTNGVNRAISSTMGSIANATAGGLILGVGVAEAFTGSSMMFAVSALAAAFFILPGTRQKSSRHSESRTARRRMGAEIREGFEWLLGEKGLLQLTISATVFNFFFSLCFSFLVVYVASALDADSIVYGAVLGVYAAGYVAGSLLPAYIHPLAHAGKIWVLVYGLAVGLSLFLMGAVPQVSVTIGFSLFIGVCAGLAGNVWLTTAQNMVPAGMRGRYFAIDGVLSFIGGPPAIAVGAVLVSAIGVTETFVFARAMMAGSALIFGSRRELMRLDGRLKSPLAAKNHRD